MEIKTDGTKCGRVNAGVAKQQKIMNKWNAMPIHRRNMIMDMEIEFSVCSTNFMHLSSAFTLITMALCITSTCTISSITVVYKPTNQTIGVALINKLYFPYRCCDLQDVQIFVCKMRNVHSEK